MTRLTSYDLTPFYRNTVGLDRLFDRITNQLDAATSGNYPPYDIVKTGEDTYEIRVAAAGFRQGEIDVEYHEGQLKIIGTQNSKELENIEYLHHGISNRQFIRTFSLADYVEVREAVMQDGILTVRLQREIPEAQKPKQIAITYAN
jgi:molecular chaperone IbpA